MTRAVNVGMGVNRVDGVDRPLTIEAQELVGKKKPQDKISLDGPAEWIDKPQIEDQILDPHLCRVIKMETKVFDLSVAADLEAYNILQSETSLEANPVTNKIMRSEKQWCPELKNWKILVDVAYFQFRKLVNQDKKDDDEDFRN